MHVTFASAIASHNTKGTTMIAITGATGHLGQLVIASLLKKLPAQQVLAIVRNPAKAKDLAALGVQVRQADYTQPAQWEAALAGVEKLLLISANDIGQRAAQHATVIKAAKRAGIKLLAYTSLLRADTSPIAMAAEHRETEVAIRASGVPFALLRNGWYTENHTMGLQAALSMGAVYGCAGDGRFSTATRADFAEAAAIVLTASGHAGQVYELAGDTAYTLTEYAAEVSRQTGKSIGYVNLPEAEFKKALLGAGLPELVAELLANSDAAAAKGALFDDGRQLSKLIGRPTTSLSAAVKAAL
jgi:NAD(P)H dehydrogenase (quinone)